MERSARERCSSRAAPLHRMLTVVGVIVIIVVAIVHVTRTTCWMLPWRDEK